MKTAEMGRVKNTSGDPCEMSRACPEGGLQHLCQDARQDHRGDGVAELPHEVPDHPEEGHDIDVEGLKPEAVGSDQGAKDDHRPQDVKGDFDDLGPHPDQRQIEDQQHHIADIHAGDDRPDEIRILDEEQRPGLEAVHHQPPQQHRHRRRRGKPEGEKRHEPGGGGGVVRRFRGADPLDRPMAEFLEDAWRTVSRHRRRQRS